MDRVRLPVQQCSRLTRIGFPTGEEQGLARFEKPAEGSWTAHHPELYEAFFPRAGEAIAYCERFPKQPEVIDGGFARIDRVREPHP